MAVAALNKKKNKKYSRIKKSCILSSLLILLLLLLYNIFLHTKRFLATRPSRGGECPSCARPDRVINDERYPGRRRSSGSRRSRAPGNLAHAKDGEQKGRKNIPLDLYKQKKNVYILFICVCIKNNKKIASLFA